MRVIAASAVLLSGAACLAQVKVPTEQSILDGLNEPERTYVIQRVESESRAAEKRTAAQPIPIGGASDLFRAAPGTFVRIPGKKTFKVNQIVDSGGVLFSDPGDLWLDGVNGSGVTDGALILLEGLFLVDKPKSYTSVTGARRNVAHAVMVNEEKADTAIALILQLRSYRTWRSKSNDHSLEDARFVAFAKGKVTLLKKGSDKEIVVPIADLSEDCQKAIRDHLKVVAERSKNRPK